MKKSKVINADRLASSELALVYRQMRGLPGASMRADLTSLTMAECF